MAIKYHNDGCNYKLPNIKRTSKWIEAVVSHQTYKLGDVNVIFCSAERLLEINKQFLNHDYFTDVITFDYSDLKGTKVVSGDIFIDIQTVSLNAHTYRVHQLDEMRRVIIHGILHLCGQKDKTPASNLVMHNKEDRYLGLFYSEDSAAESQMLTTKERRKRSVYVHKWNERLKRDRSRPKVGQRDQ